MSRQDQHFRLRLPPAMKSWIAEEARRNLRSITAEINFILAQRMNAATGKTLGRDPVAAPINHGFRGTADDRT